MFLKIGIIIILILLLTVLRRPLFGNGRWIFTIPFIVVSIIGAMLGLLFSMTPSGIREDAPIIILIGIGCALGVCFKPFVAFLVLMMGFRHDKSKD